MNIFLSLRVSRCRGASSREFRNRDVLLVTEMRRLRRDLPSGVGSDLSDRAGRLMSIPLAERQGRHDDVSTEEHVNQRRHVHVRIGVCDRRL